MDCYDPQEWRTTGRSTPPSSPPSTRTRSSSSVNSSGQSPSGVRVGGRGQPSVVIYQWNASHCQYLSTPKIFLTAEQLRSDGPRHGARVGGGLVLPHRLDGPLGGHDIGGAWGFSSSRLYINRMLKARCTFFFGKGGGAGVWCVVFPFPLPSTLTPWKGPSDVLITVE